jgi:uncharacterized protein YqhQ
VAGDAVKEERLQFGGMARWDGLDLFGPNFMSIAYRKEGEIHVKVEHSNIPKIENPLALRISRLPILRSIFLWSRLLLQVVGSFWTLVFFAATMAVLWLFVRLMEFGGGGGGFLGGLFSFFAEFPILPIMLLFFAGIKLSPVGRYHGAEHKTVAAYEKYGEVTMQGAKSSSRVHPRCGTNILAYIVLAALLDPLISWWAYAFLQFILISEAWFIFGQTRPSIAVGNIFQRYLTTTEPRRAELEVAVESMNRLLEAEQGRAGGEKRVRVPASY